MRGKKTIKLGVDGRILTESGGLKRYAYNLLKGIRESDFIEKIFVFCNGKKPDCMCEDNKVEFVNVIYFKDKHNILWENDFLPFEIKKRKIDIFHNFANWGLPLKKCCKYVLTVHDLIPLKYPEFYRHIDVFPDAWSRMKMDMKNADAIMTDTNYVFNQIVNAYVEYKNKISVIHLGVEDVFKKYEDDDLKEIKEKLGLPEKFILFTGKFDPRKNITVVLKVVNELKKRGWNISLVATGEKEAFEASKVYYDLNKLIGDLSIGDLVHFTGYLADKELAYLYNLAEVVLYPSKEEGFGFPVLEAMACETPIIASDIGSIRELAGDAIAYVNPENADEIVKKMEILLKNGKMRNKYVDIGKKRVKNFKWDKAVEKTLEVYKKLAGYWNA